VALELTGRGIGICTDGQNLVPVFVRKAGRVRQALVVPPKGLGSYFVTISGPVQIAVKAWKISSTDGFDPRFPAEAVGPVYTNTFEFPISKNGRQLNLKVGAFGLE
jgi:hypothetical protein